jgi:hypothetical protein
VHTYIFPLRICLRAKEKMKETQVSGIQLPQVGYAADYTAGGRGACTGAWTLGTALASGLLSLLTTRANEDGRQLHGQPHGQLHRQLDIQLQRMCARRHCQERVGRLAARVRRSRTLHE